MAKQVDVNIAAHNVQIVPSSIQHDTLSRCLPCPIVCVHPWDLGDGETEIRNINIIVAINNRGQDLSGTICEKEARRMSCVIAGELEALLEATWSYSEGVGDFDVPAV
jgi:hypothetical protein